MRDIEILQIDKVAELLRKETYHKNGNYQDKSTRSDRILSEQLTAESAKSHFEFIGIRQSAPFRRNYTSELVRIPK